MKNDNGTHNKNSIYEASDDNDRLVEEIKSLLSTSRKIINANYTKDNFAKLKSDYPELWDKVKDKTIYYKSNDGNVRSISFFQKDYTPLIYNDIVVSSKNVWKNCNLRVLIENTNNNSPFKDIIKVCAENKLSGVQLLQIARKAFPTDYQNLLEIRKKCKHDREALYCYYHNMQPVKCNGKHLCFQTLSVGYSYEALAKFANKHDKQNLRKFVLELNKIDCNSVTDFIERYFPQIHSEIIKECPAKLKSESYHLFMYEKDKPDECLFCSNECKFKTLNTGYTDFCSEKCRAVYYGLSRRVYRDPEKWAEYKMLVEFYTNVTYKKYKNIINPLNLPRGLKKHHIDHILPKIYGFENNIDPKRIAHFKNLQMLTAVENNKKNAKIKDDHAINVVLDLTEDDLKYFELYDKKIL